MSTSQRAELMWSDYMTGARNAKKKSRMDEAERQFLLALEQSESFDEKDPRIAETLGELADSIDLRDRYSDGALYARRALSAKEKSAGVDHLDLVPSLQALAAILVRESTLEESLALHNRSIEILEHSIGKNHPDTIECILYAKNCSSFQEQEELEREIITRVQQSLKDIETLDFASPGASLRLWKLAQIYGHLGMKVEANELFVRCIESKKAAHGANSPEVGLFLCELAQNFDCDTNKREPYIYDALKILEIFETCSDSDQENESVFAPFLSELAQACSMISKYAESISIYRRLIQKKESAVVCDYYDLHHDFKSMAYQHLYAQEPVLAWSAFEQAIKLVEDATGGASEDLADLLLEVAHHSPFEPEVVAERFYKRAVDIRTKLLGAQHSKVAATHIALADYYAVSGKAAWAEATLQEALTILRSIADIDDDSLSCVIWRLGSLQREQRNYMAAEATLKSGLQTREESGASPDISLNHWHGTISFALAKVYFEQGNFATAEPLFEAVVNREDPMEWDFDFYFEPTFQLAITYQKLRKNSQAEPLFLRCIEFLEPTIEANSPEDRQINDVVLNAYIALLRASNRHTEADKVALRLSKNRS